MRPLTIEVLGNDLDVDGDTLVVDSITDPSNGTVADNEDGTITYSPDRRFTGRDSFTYTIRDGEGGRGDAIVSVTVTEDICLEPGGTLRINDGVYTDWDMVVMCSGTADNPVTIRPETLHGVTLTGRTRFVIDADHVVLRGFTFQENRAVASVVIRRGRKRNRITRCRFIRCGDSEKRRGIVIVEGEGSYNRIDHCVWIDSQSKGLVLASGSEEGDEPEVHVAHHNRVGCS
jgi:hypothetical protein